MKKTNACGIGERRKEASRLFLRRPENPSEEYTRVGVAQCQPGRLPSQPALARLGKAIRHTREAKGISQENLALTAELDRSYLGRVERGDNNVAILTLAKIAKALGVSVAKLMAKAKL